MNMEECIAEIDKLGLTQKQYEDCVQLIIDKKINKTTDIDWADILREYNLDLNKDSLRKANDTVFGGAFVAEYYRNKVMDKEVSEKGCASETSINKDGSWSSKKFIQMNEQQAKDPNFILMAHGFDPKCWEIVSVRNTIRQAISQAEGTVTLFASFLTTRPTNKITLAQIDEHYQNLVETYAAPKVKKIESCTDGYMLEIPIVDLHLGKLSMSEDVSEPYNFEIARDRFNYIIDSVINNVKGLPIEKVVFPVGSDFFNVDTLSNTTTGGTAQDCDISPSVMFDYGTKLLIDGITKLYKELKAPVEVFCINGNHDFLTSYHAICTIWAYFHNNENVIVSKETSPRKYVEFGNCLIGFAHGDKERKRIESIMQVEAREAWGRVKFCEFHLGHLHSEQTKETGGIIIRNLSSVTGSDAWHHRSGYVGALKKSQSFIWDKKYGLKNIIYTVID